MILLLRFINVIYLSCQWTPTRWLLCPGIEPERTNPQFLASSEFYSSLHPYLVPTSNTNLQHPLEQQTKKGYELSEILFLKLTKIYLDQGCDHESQP